MRFDSFTYSYRKNIVEKVRCRFYNFHQCFTMKSILNKSVNLWLGAFSWQLTTLLCFSQCRIEFFPCPKIFLRLRRSKSVNAPMNGPKPCFMFLFLMTCNCEKKCSTWDTAVHNDTTKKKLIKIFIISNRCNLVYHEIYQKLYSE